MPRKIEQLSTLQIGRVRANLSRKATQIGNRLSAHALGETDKNGKPIEMTPSQINAAKVVLQHVLPAQQQTELEEIKPDRADPLKTKRQLEETLLELASKASPEFKQELRETLDSKPTLVRSDIG